MTEFSESLSKDDALRRLNAALGLRLDLGVGSSVPTAVFSATTRMFGVSDVGSMPDRAERAVRAAGLDWTEDCDSRHTPSGGGSTVTLAGLNRLVQAVEQVGGSPNVAARSGSELGVPYVVFPRGVDATPAGLVNDLARLDRATSAHRSMLEEVAALVLSRGHSPRRPAAGEPSYDLAWTINGVAVILIAKTTVPANHRQQVRLGLGELLECVTAFHQGEQIAAAVLLISGQIAHVDSVLSQATDTIFVSQRDLGELERQKLI